MSLLPQRHHGFWPATLLAGAVAGASAQLLELVAVARPPGVRDGLVAVALLALLGALAQSGLALLVALPLRRRLELGAPGGAERWSIATAIALAAALIGAGSVIHIGVGVRGGLRTLAIAYAAWCVLAVIAGSRLASWLAPRLSARGRFPLRSALALLALVLAAAALGSARGEARAIAPGRALSGASRPAAPREPPPGSVVLIVLDTTRVDALGAYAALAGETPVFDRLAAGGQLFEEMISASPWTVPSHATFFTGLQPRDHDCWFGGRRWLEDDLETIAERFRARGLETAAFYGNDNLAPANLLQGFVVHDFLEAPPSGLALGWVMRFTGVGFPEWIDRGSSRAVDDVDAWMANRRSDRPFFLFVNLFEAHEPYVSPLRDHVLPPGVGELESFRVLRGYRERVWHSLGRSQGRQEDIVRAAYRSSIRYQDRMLGRLLDVIAGRYAIDRLPLVVTADHGENLGEGGRWGHQFALNDELIHIPLLLRAPGRVTAGRRVAGSFSSVDLAATLLDLAGAGDRFGKGRSLLGDRAPEAATFAEDYPFYVTLNLLERGFASGLGDFRWPMSAIRADDHKLVLWHGGPARLYDLRADPTEARDVLAARPKLAAQLLARFTAWSRDNPHQRRAESAAHQPPTTLDPELADQLRALGYL